MGTLATQMTDRAARPAMTSGARPAPRRAGRVRRAAFGLVAAGLLAACAGGGGGVPGSPTHHRTANPEWAELTGLPAASVAGVTRTDRGGLVLIDPKGLSAAQIANVPTVLCAASKRSAAAPGKAEPLDGLSGKPVRKIVVRCRG